MPTGIKVSQAGHGVGTATDDLLIVNDEYPIFKVKEEGDGTLTLPLGDLTASETITHNLGHKSAVLIYTQLAEGSSERHQVSGRTPFVATGDEISMECEIQTNTFVVTANAGGTDSSDRDYIFHYYVTHEEL